MRVLAVIGTRPEAIKMAPVMTALAAAGGIAARLCLTGQHRDLPAPVLALFGVAVDAALAPMPPGCGPAGVAGHVLAGLPRVLAALRPDLVLVHGDTTTALAAALAAHYRGIAVGHVEAGLRTGDLAAPWPEEANRRMVAALAALHFAPTGAARANLLAENVAAAAIHVTGNTVIDALYRTVAIVADDPARARDGGGVGGGPGRRSGRSWSPRTGARRLARGSDGSARRSSGWRRAAMSRSSIRSTPTPRSAGRCARGSAGSPGSGCCRRRIMRRSSG